MAGTETDHKPPVVSQLLSSAVADRQNGFLFELSSPSQNPSQPRQVLQLDFAPLAFEGKPIEPGGILRRNLIKNFSASGEVSDPKAEEIPPQAGSAKMPIHIERPRQEEVSSLDPSRRAPIPSETERTPAAITGIVDPSAPAHDPEYQAILDRLDADIADYKAARASMDDESFDNWRLAEERAVDRWDNRPSIEPIGGNFPAEEAKLRAPEIDHYAPSLDAPPEPQQPISGGSELPREAPRGPGPGPTIIGRPIWSPIEFKVVEAVFESAGSNPASFSFANASLSITKESEEIYTLKMDYETGPSAAYQLRRDGRLVPDGPDHRAYINTVILEAVRQALQDEEQSHAE